MEIEKLLKDSWEIFQKNIVAFIVGTLIAVIGSILIVTIAPLFYGVTYMAVKAIKGETVEIGDVFAGFKVPGAFVQSWIVFCVLLASIVVLVILGIVGYVYSLLFSSETILVIIAALAFVINIVATIMQSLILIYAMPLLVTRRYAGKDALKEAAKLIQSNLTDTIILFLIFIFSNFIGYLLLSIIRLPPIIGLLLTLPISMIVCILVVQNLTGEKPTWET